MSVATTNQAASQPATIIIKKVKKGGHAHHGGAWKVAYADFVTAMMAFFLLLWLLNATTEEQKAAISNYFAPEAPAYTKSGSGGVLGGRVIAKDGGATASRGGGGIVVPIPRAPRSRADNTDEAGEKSPPRTEDDSPLDETGRVSRKGLDGKTGSGVDSTNGKADERRARELQKQMEAQKFARIEKSLRRALTESPELTALSDSLLIDRTREGLRIQLTDQARLAMFPRGSSKMLAHTRKILFRLAAIVKRLTNRISVTGHTDSTPYANTDGYSNWELSTDRANASRRVLIEAGLDPHRFAQVVGKADQEPLLPDDPTNPRNRRISIVVLSAVPDGAAGHRSNPGR